MISRRKSCFCAFCKTPRKVYADKHLTYVQVLSLVLMGIILTFGIYQSLDPRGLYLIAGILMVAEVFMQIRWRASMICRNCGFDPVIYVRSPEAAGLKIKAFLETRSDSPNHLLRPPVVLPILRDQKGKNLSLKM